MLHKFTSGKNDHNDQCHGLFNVCMIPLLMYGDVSFHCLTTFGKHTFL